MIWTIERKLLIAFGLALGVVMMVGIVAYRNARQFIDTNQRLTHTLNVIGELDAVLSHILDAETGQRGYIITGDESYLEPYYSTNGTIDKSLQNLQLLTGDTPHQQSRLEALTAQIDEKLRFIENTIALVLASSSDVAAQLVLTGEGKEMMDRIRAIIADMAQEEHEQLAVQRASSVATAEATLLTFTALITLTIILLSVTYWFVNRNITAMQQTQSALRLSQEKWRSLVEHAPNIITTFDVYGVVEFINRSTSGTSFRDFLGKNVSVLVSANDQHALSQAIESVRSTLKPSNFEMVSTSGRYFTITLAPILIDGHLTGFISSSSEITERKQAELRLRQYAEELRDLYDNAPCGYHSLDRDGVFVQINETELKWLGYEREEVVGKLRFSDVITAESLRVFQENFPKFKERGWVNDLEFEMVRKDGSSFVVSLNATAVRDDAGNYVSSRSTIFNITERRQKEREIEELNKELELRTIQLEATNKELEAFSYSVSHDLRAPLRALGGFSQALLEDYSDQLDANGRQYLERIRAAASRMASLIDDLINLSRITRTEMKRQSVDLTELARIVASDLQSREPDRQVEFIIQEGLLVDGDPRLLRVALENLLGNSWKFTSRNPQSQIEVGILKPGEDEHVFFVRDDGDGFDMAFADKLFGAFQRLHGMTEFEGTGIGLATVQRVIHRHGGRVWAEGAVGKGATFYFTL